MKPKFPLRARGALKPTANLRAIYRVKPIHTVRATFFRETHKKPASQIRNETQISVASQKNPETHIGCASLTQREEVMQHESEIRLLTDSFYEVQKTRIQIGNRIAMLKRDYEIDEAMGADLHEMVSGRLIDTEKEIEKRVRKYVKPIPVYQLWIGPHVKGVSELLAGSLIAGIGDIGRFDTVSKLWKFCGMGINADGSIQKFRKGEKANWNPFLKKTCWKIGESFVKIADRGYYGQMLHTYKSREIGKCEKNEIMVMPQADIDKLPKEQRANYMSAGHVHNRAKRKAVKLFLSHLWQVWRECEGLPTNQPYVTMTDPEHHYYEPPFWGKQDSKVA